MSFFTKIIDLFSSTPTIHTTGVVPNYEPEEVEATRMPKLHTKTSLMKLTKKQLEAIGKDEFNIELDRRKTKAILVKKLLSTIKKAR